MNTKINSHFKQTICTTVLLLLLAGFQLSAWADDVTATWDFQNNNPTGIQTLNAIEGTTGTVNSDVEGIALTVDATKGKFAPRTNGDCQINATTAIQIPVKTVKDVIMVTNYSSDANQYNITYTIGTASGINAQSYSYTATVSDVETGYATLTVTTSGYIRAITVTQKDPNSLYNATVTTVEELRTALASASGTASSPSEIFIKNGTYDLGTDNNTEVKDYTHLMGESRDGVIIKNSPETEGLGTTATLKTGSHVRIKDLTLKCRAPWSGSAERGVCLWDAGTGNIYENICLDGLQDTYYSNGAAGMTCTFTDCIIRGTVDFICGSGKITFNSCSLQLVVSHGGSAPIIAAPATYTSETAGFVFNDCTIDKVPDDYEVGCTDHPATTIFNVSDYHLARAWYAGNGTDRTPRVSFNNVTYNVTPHSEKWASSIGTAPDTERRVFSATESETATDNAERTITWDWKNHLPAGINGITIEGKVGNILSAVTGVELYVDATNGKLAGRDTDAQFNANTIIRVPVRSAGDVVTVVSYPDYHNYTVGGTAADADTYTYTATAVDATNGYVAVTATGSSYLYSISVRQIEVTASRTFTDFKIDFRTETPTIVYPAGGLPENVVLDKGTYHGSQHGTMNGQLKFPVDGPVRITIGGCQYTGTNATIKDGNDELLTTLDQKSAGCDGGFGSYNKNVTWTYNSEEAQTLTVNLGEYCPYIEVVACDYIPQATVTYYDTDGTTVVGSHTVNGGSALAFAYGAANVTVSEGYKFRGWFDKASGGKKIAEGTAVNADLNLYAVATEIEVCDHGKTFNYDLTDPLFYPEDHECIHIEGGKYNGSLHGWQVNQSLSVPVAGKAILSFTLCTYSNTQTISVTDESGTVLQTISHDNQKGDQNITFDYDGTATTLKIVMQNTAYIHSVRVENLPLEDPEMKIVYGKETVTLNVGGTYTLQKDVDFTDNYPDNNYTYTSGNTEIVAVDANGKITAGNKYGQAVVTVHHDKTTTLAAADLQFTVKVISKDGQVSKPALTINNDGSVSVGNIGETGISFYYTTDGNEPTALSTKVTDGTIASTLTGGKVIKVIAIDDNNAKSPSDIVTAYVNVEGTFKWNWNTTGVLQTTPIIEGNVADIIDENTKVVIGKKLTPGASTQNGISTVTVGPTDGIAVTEVDEESTLSFNIIPAAGIAFKPSAVSFKALRISTGSGLMDVHLKNENSDYPLLNKALPGLDVLTSYYNTSFKMTDISTIPAAAEEWSLKYYIYTLTKGKTWGFSNIVISGTFTGVEYDGVFYKISATAEPTEGGTVTHAPAAGKAQPGKKVTFHASPNKGYRFVEWRDFEGEEAARTTATFSVASLSKDLSYDAVFEKLPRITFVNNQAETLMGTVPDAAYTLDDHTFTIPENTTLYREGYALTAWTDGTTTYTVGGTYTFTEDVTLKPVVTKSDKAVTDTDSPLVATWYFDKKDGAPIISWEGTDVVFNYTKSVSVGETKVDLNMVMTGAKADNDDARVNFVTDGNGNEARGGQLNNGMTLTIPAVYGMTVKMQASLKKDFGNDGKSTPNETYFQNVPNNGNPATLSFTDGGTTTTATGTTTMEDRVLTFKYTGDATTLTVTVDNAGSVGTYGYFRCLEVTYPVLPDVKTINVITSTPLITEWEKAENAGSTTKTDPDPNGNTGKRYKPGAQVTLTANAAYGYYITAFKDGETTLAMTKVNPSAESEQPTTAKAVYTVQATPGTITVEYARLPMAKVRLETVDKSLGTVDFNPVEIHSNFYEKGDGYVQSWFVANSTVTGSSDASDDYVLEKWMKADDNTQAGTGPTLSITAPAEGGAVTYHAYFTLGKPGNIVFDVTGAMLLKDGSLTAFSVDAKSTKPEDQTNSRSFYIPKYHGMFRSYNAEDNEKGYTLKYWVKSGNTNSKYEIGKNYSFATEGETITLIPVFEENPGGMQNRVNNPVITYEFGIGPGIRAQRLNLPKKTDTYLCAPVDVEIWEDSQEKNHTRDVALWVNTGEKGFVRNTDFQEWAAIGPGTTLTVASCAGTKIEILSYAPISTTTIDGVVPTEYEKIGEHEYVYSYTTQNPAARIPIVIGDDYSYYKWIKAHTLAANRVQLHARVANSDQGVITKTEAIHAVVEGDKKVYIEKMDDGGFSLIQGTRTKISFERKFGYTLDKIVDPDKIVNGEPLAVLEMLDNGNVKMVQPDDATVTEEVSPNADGSWGTKETVFLLRQSEPTAEEKAAGKRTKYEVEFEITKHRNLLFYFKEEKTYYITFNAGKQATGIAPSALWVEANDEYAIPANHTLYYSGYTLKRWKDEAGKIYNIGSKYKAPAADLRLFPEFELNTFSLLDSDLPEATATWHFTRKQGAPDINYERSSGILVTQLHKSDAEFIDLRLDLDASDRKDGNGNTIKGKFNNLADQERCQINMHSIMNFPVTKGCEMELEANSAISTTSICGATAENGGYEAGNKVRYTWHGGEGIQQVYFQNDGRYYTYFSIKYKPQTIEKPALAAVSYAGAALTDEQLNTLKTNKEITLEACPITLDPVTGKFLEEKMQELAATATGTGKVTVTQPTLDTPTGYIRLFSGGEALLETYIVHFSLKAPTSMVEGAETTPKFLYTEINGEKFYSHEVSVENMPASGYIKVVFDRTMKAKDLTFTVGGQSMTFSAEQGKALTFYYWSIPNVTLDNTFSGTDFVDIYGQRHQEGDFKKHFETRGTTKEIVHKTFDFIVGEDGSLDDAIQAANAHQGTDRYLIFIPDGEYQLTGNESLAGRYSITSDGAWPCDGEGNAVTDEMMSNLYNYENGMTQVTRSRVSVIGQSREGVTVWNKPVVEGIGYTATIHVGQGAVDFYAEDISMENRFPYWSSMGGGSGAGRAVVLWDQGQRTTLKNVSLMSWQDTYYSSNANDDYRGYFENCQLGGVVDWICGDGNIWFEQCDIIVRDRAGNNIAAPSQEVTQQWGYVLKDCHVKPEIPLDQTEELKDKTWTMARPWANSKTKSPAITFINTRMHVLPKDQGWGVMMGNSVLRFHENHSMDGNGTVLSLGARTLASASPAAGSDDCVMNDGDAEKYTLQNVLGGMDGYTPRERTLQIDAASGGADAYDATNSVVWNDNIEIDDERLLWNAHENALCYFIFKRENGRWVYKRNVTETSISLDQVDLGAGEYYVRAANQYGGLGAPTMSLKYDGTKQYVLQLKEVGGIPGYGWSTICLSANTKAPEGVTVFAATAHNEVTEDKNVMDYLMTLTPVQVLNKDMGYIVYGPVGEYTFKATSRESSVPTILRGNSSNYPLPATNIHCYVLADKTWGIGFYKFSGSELKAKRAWLPADKVSADVQQGLSLSGKAIRFSFPEETGMGAVLYAPQRNASDAIYNLSGQRLRDVPRKGIYIRKGELRVRPMNNE